jgi:hypothetical protein
VSFSTLYRWFDRRCRSYERKAVHLYTHRHDYSDWEFRFLTDALLSDIWQSWSLFSRIILLKSIRGTKARDGSFVIGLKRDNSWNRILYEISNSLKGRAVTNTGHVNFKIRFELTWGDINVMLRAIQHMAPNNAATLLSAYGMPFNGIKHMQQVRNAAAHKNIETINDIQSLSIHYNTSVIKSPMDVIWAHKHTTTTLAIEQWLYEINLIADLATSTK